VYLELHKMLVYVLGVCYMLAAFHCVIFKLCHYISHKKYLNLCNCLKLKYLDSYQLNLCSDITAPVSQNVNKLVIKM
jgi:hypothetical protein